MELVRLLRNFECKEFLVEFPVTSYTWIVGYYNTWIVGYYNTWIVGYYNI